MLFIQFSGNVLYFLLVWLFRKHPPPPRLRGLPSLNIVTPFRYAPACIAFMISPVVVGMFSNIQQTTETEAEKALVFWLCQ